MVVQGSSRLSPRRASPILLLLLEALLMASAFRSAGGAASRVGLRRAAMTTSGKSRLGSAASPSWHSPPPAEAGESEEVGKHTALSSALAGVDEYMEEEERSERRADETGELGMPPKHRHIVIDGVSVAYLHGEHKRFSVEGIERAINFFRDKGYPHVIAFVGYKYSQEIGEGSSRSKTGDNIKLLKDMNERLHPHPPQNPRILELPKHQNPGTLKCPPPKKKLGSLEAWKPGTLKPL